MACPVQPPPPPSLDDLLAQLASVDPVEAEHHRDEVAALVLKLAQAREGCSRAEVALAVVRADGTLATYDEWCLRSSAVSGARREAHLLEVDARCLREVLERALFLAQHDKAAGRQRCQDCQGSGEGPAIPGGISLEYPPCDACAGLGWCASRSAPVARARGV